MSARPAPFRGDFETEVALPCRVTFRVTCDGEVELTALAPLGQILPPGTLLAIPSLSPREHECLLAEAEAAVQTACAAANLAHEISRHETRTET